MTDEQIIKGILNVERSIKRVQNPNGKNPVCKPIVAWVSNIEILIKERRSEPPICERCGKPIDIGKACEAVPPEERWDVVEE